MTGRVVPELPASGSRQKISVGDKNAGRGTGNLVPKTGTTGNHQIQSLAIILEKWFPYFGTGWWFYSQWFPPP